MINKTIFTVIFLIPYVTFCQDKTSIFEYSNGSEILNTWNDIPGTKCKQDVHQKITKEAFNLLKYSLQNRFELNEMESYIGNSETMPSSGIMSIGYPTIVSGSWVEDEFDVVYWYGMMGNLPSGSYDPMLLFNLGNLFDPGALSKGFVSCTHFWNADKGLEDSYTYLTDDGHYGITYFEFAVGPIPNSYKKALKFINGGYDEMWCSETPYTLGSRKSTHFAWKRPFNLFQLYNGTTTKMYLKGYLNLDSGNEGWEDADDPSSTADPDYYILLENVHKKLAYTTLGRICHLLEDNSMPVHVHNVSHGGVNGMYSDNYEEDILTTTYIENILSTYKLDTFIDPYLALLSDNLNVDPIEYLFYCQNQIADVLDSYIVYGDTNYSTDYPRLNEYINEIDSKATLELKREYLVGTSIKFVAGLLYWFLVESGQLMKINYYQKGGILENNVVAENDIIVRNITTGSINELSKTLEAGKSIIIQSNSILTNGFHASISND